MLGEEQSLDRGQADAPTRLQPLPDLVQGQYGGHEGTECGQG